VRRPQLACQRCELAPVAEAIAAKAIAVIAASASHFFSIPGGSRANSQAIVRSAADLVSKLERTTRGRREDGDMDDNDARVLDFLDDKLQTAGDLDSLDELLATITAQHGLLKQQLGDAQRDLHDAKHHQHEHHRQLQDKAAAFHREQHDMDRRLLVMTASETSDDAVPRFEAALGTLQRLDVAGGYMELLRDVDVLR
jgi:chromosome segregation ATPase